MASGLHPASALSADEALRGLWRQAGLPPEALAFARLTGSGADLPSSFAVGVAAQASIAGAALAACEFAHDRGAPRQQVTVDSAHAAIECTGWFSLDGRSPDLWDPLSGLYRCADGFVRIHANFAHHREGALRLLGLRPGEAERADVQSALTDWRAHDFEDAAARAGLVATALRSFAEWDATPQGRAIAAQPLFTIERLAGDAPPLPLPPLAEQDRPLAGVRVLDLTRILAGPVGGKALAAYGADVMLVNAPHLPNIDAIADTSRGKLSTHIDLRAVEGQAAMRSLLAGAHVWVQGYRPGGLQALGWGPDEVAAMRPGIVYVSLSAYATRGPWAGRRGFDSLVQTAMGFNQAEGEAAGGGAPGRCLCRSSTKPPATSSPWERQRLCAASSAKAASGMCRCRWRRPGTGCAAWAGCRRGWPHRLPIGRPIWKRPIPDSAGCRPFGTARNWRAPPLAGSGSPCRRERILRAGPERREACRAAG